MSEGRKKRVPAISFSGTANPPERSSDFRKAKVHQRLGGDSCTRAAFAKQVLESAWRRRLRTCHRRNSDRPTETQLLDSVSPPTAALIERASCLFGRLGRRVGGKHGLCRAASAAISRHGRKVQQARRALQQEVSFSVCKVKLLLALPGCTALSGTPVQVGSI